MERQVFLDLFINHGVSADEVRAMSDTEFAASLNAYLDETDPSPPRAPPPSYAPSFNNGLDEEEAVRQAIARSLEEPFLPSPARRPLVADAILRRPVGLHSPTRPRPAAIADGPAPQGFFIARKPVGTFATFSENADSPADTTPLLQSQSENADLDDFPEESEQQRCREYERRRRQDELAARFRALPQEPRRGVALAVSMPNGSRIKRTFEPDTPGEAVYIWVAGSTIGWEKELEINDFELEIPLGMKRVERARTLAEQGITGRVVLAVSQF